MMRGINMGKMETKVKQWETEYMFLCAEESSKGRGQDFCWHCPGNVLCK
jgi:hypothetical protein